MIPGSSFTSLPPPRSGGLGGTRLTSFGGTGRSGLRQGVRPLKGPSQFRGGPVHRPGFQPGGPAKPQVPGQAGQQPGGGDPALDAQYYLNVAANQFRVNNQLNALNQQGGYARTDLQSALSQLGHQQPIDQLHEEQGANRQGGLFSTVLGQNLGQLNRNYLDRQSADTLGFERGEAARQQQGQALEGGIPIYNAGQYLAAVQRASLLAQKNPATGESSKPLVKGGRGVGGGVGGGRTGNRGVGQGVGGGRTGNRGAHAAHPGGRGKSSSQGWRAKLYLNPRTGHSLQQQGV